MGNESSQNEQRTTRRAGMNDVARKMTGGNKTAGIVIAICMVVLGILIFAAPHHGAGDRLPGDDRLHRLRNF